MGADEDAATRRQTRLLDAAVRVLGEKGPRGLTHRAVDEAAKVAKGSTGNYYPTRESLITAVGCRLERLEVDAWINLSRDLPEDALSSVDNAARALARLTMVLVEPERLTATRARIVLQVTEPGLLRSSSQRITALVADAFGELGLAQPALRARLALDLMNGTLVNLVSSRLPLPTEDQLADGIAALLRF